MHLMLEEYRVRSIHYLESNIDRDCYHHKQASDDPILHHLDNLSLNIPMFFDRIRESEDRMRSFIRQEDEYQSLLPKSPL
jgi:hypothetical protein